MNCEDLMFDKVMRAMHRHSDGTWEEMHHRGDRGSNDLLSVPHA